MTYPHTSTAEHDDAQFYLELLRAYVDSANDAIFVLCDELKFIVCNALMQEWLGMPEEKLIRHNDRIPIVDLLGNHAAKHAFDEAFTSALAGKPTRFECEINPPQGDHRWLEIQLSRVRVDAGSMVMAVARDISERKHSVAELIRQATYDQLTGLPAFSLLRKRLRERIAQGSEAFAVVTVSLDRFREINNVLGHRYGDQTLCQIAQRLRSEAPQGALVARHGGDEFAMLLPEADPEVLMRMCQQMREHIGAPITLRGVEQQVGEAFRLDLGVSFGFVCYPHQGDDADTLLRRAGMAVVYAKQHHRGVVEYGAAMDDAGRDQLLLLSELRRAVKEDELELHFQPIIEACSGRLLGAETLVRWRHPEQGLLAPDRFIPLAEQTGLIHLVDQWVLAHAVEQAAKWHAKGRPLCVSVNISAHSLDGHELILQLKQLLHQHPLDLGGMMLEITESALMADPEHSLDLMRELTRLGVVLALDDYGTGYSSLAYLRRFPLGRLKMDRAFIRELTRNTTDRAIVRSTLDLAHELGLLVVAEGVEDQATLDALAHMRCDAVQGFHIGRPMPLAEFERWVGQREA